MAILFYFTAVLLAMLYAFIILAYPNWTLAVPKKIWQQEKIWVRETTFFYFAIIVGMTINGLLLLPFFYQPRVRLALCTSGLVATLLSFLVDVKRRSLWGISFDLIIIVLLTLALTY